MIHLLDIFGYPFLDMLIFVGYVAFWISLNTPAFGSGVAAEYPKQFWICLNMFLLDILAFCVRGGAISDTFGYGISNIFGYVF